ncbi:MAG: sodium/glutamate symporter [Planctomycetaceae bacterium]|nr:sodium/glutamate symporter [Planctomycetaceae bacterium]
MAFQFDLIQTLALAVVVLFVGQKVNAKIPALQKYCIPSPVVGGLLFCFITFLGNQTGAFTVKLDNSLVNFLLVMFFTSTGFLASVAVFKRSGRQGVFLALIAIGTVIIQNVIGVGLSQAFGLHPLLGINIGSAPLVGGLGTAAAFGPTLEGLGATGATTVGVAAATFGMVLGCIIGGPIAKRLIEKNSLATVGEQKTVDLGIGTAEPSTAKSVAGSFFLLLITMALGSYLVLLMNKTGIAFPYYVGGVFAAAIVRNVADAGLFSVRSREIDGIANVALGLFLALSLMTLRIWELLNLAVPMLVILAVQTIVLGIVAYYVVFRALGKDYESAVMSSGYCGVGLGQMPNAVANMATLIQRYGPAPNAWFMLPVITVIFLNIFNPLIISLIMNWYQ